MKMKMMIILIGFILSGCLQVPTFPTEPVKILFIGNSLIYTGNLPAVFSSLAYANKKRVSTSMIANGGATLSDRLQNELVKSVLNSEKYSNVILQERGGDIICAFGPESCINSKHAIVELTKISRQNGANALLLGSYQEDPGASNELVAAENAIAMNAGIPIISVSANFQIAKKTVPTGKWFYKDRAHPGNDLVLLQAVLLYRHFFGEYPNPIDFQVNAPIFRPNARFPQGVHQSRDGVDEETPMVYTYSAADVLMVSGVIRRGNSK